jgi:hypothetical protein
MILIIQKIIYIVIRNQFSNDKIGEILFYKIHLTLVL